MTSPVSVGEDYYIEDGKVVFTSLFLLKRGYCCNSGCRHCPYKTSKDTDMSDQVQPFSKEEVVLLEEALLLQKQELTRVLSRTISGKEDVLTAKIQQLDILLLKIKSFKNN